MSVSGVSFKSVIAVSGGNSKIRRVNEKLYPQAKIGNIIMKDVTNHYKHASSSGVLAQSAQKGDRVEIYITGDDAQKLRKKEQGWDTLDGILSNLSMHLLADRMSVSDIVEKIFSS